MLYAYVRCRLQQWLLASWHHIISSLTIGQSVSYQLRIVSQSASYSSLLATFLMLASPSAMFTTFQSVCIIIYPDKFGTKPQLQNQLCIFVSVISIAPVNCVRTVCEIFVKITRQLDIFTYIYARVRNYSIKTEI